MLLESNCWIVFAYKRCSESFFRCWVCAWELCGSYPLPSFCLSSPRRQECTFFWVFCVSYQCTTLSRSTPPPFRHHRSQSAEGSLCTIAWSWGRVLMEIWGLCWGRVGTLLLQLWRPRRREQYGSPTPPAPLRARAGWSVIMCARIRAPPSDTHTHRRQSLARARTGARGRSRSPAHHLESKLGQKKKHF